MLYEYDLLQQQTLPCFGQRMSFEERLEDVCKSREIPGVVLAADGPGDYKYRNAFGYVRGKNRRGYEPLQTDATFGLADCTKLMTTVAALQCVDRGLVTLDEDITRILPEFQRARMLMGFDERTGAPILVNSFVTLTLRHLLTHTSGISHPCWNPVLYQYVSSQGRPPVSLNSAGRVDRILSFPLMFEPGTSWEYGAGLDWAGKVVERLTGMSLQQYMESNIWMPLGMDSCTFRLTERPDVQAKLVRKMTREGLHHPHYGTTTKPNGRLIPVDDEDLTVSIGRDAKVVELPDDYCEEYEEGTDDLGGSGIYSSAPDFARLLHTLCFGDACDKILSKTMVDEMFTPQLSASTRAALISFFSIKEVRDIFGQGIGPIALDFGLGGLLVQEDVPSRSSSPMPGRPHTPQHVRGNINRSVSASPQLSRYTRRRKGSMFWSSLQNIHWWMDRETGVSGVYASQLIPQGDPRSLHWLGRYEEMIYEKIGC